MANAFGFLPQGTKPAPTAQAVGQALLQRRGATNPANAQPGMPQMVGNTMQGALPQVGRRLLQAPPQSIPTPTGNQFGGFN